MSRRPGNQPSGRARTPLRADTVTSDPARSGVRALPDTADSSAIANGTASSPGAWWDRDWSRGLLLAAAVLLAYQPVWHAGFIWDDDVYVTTNSLLTAPDGLKRIWFSLDSPSQYFPLVYTTFRLERALWGLNPAGYHWVNLLLHAANALLLWRLLRRLNLPAAWLAAAIFALHPVHVESVAWITERKNVLSLLFSLLTFWAYVRYTEVQSPKCKAQSQRAEGKRQNAEGGMQKEQGAGRNSLSTFDSPTINCLPSSFYYVLSLALYALALFSKTTACTLPAAMLLVLWWKAKPMDGRRLAQVAPFVAMGVGMGLLAMWWERYHQGTQGKAFALGLPERVLVASRAVWFYASKLVWPADLTFSYPRWEVSRANPWAYSWLVAGIGLCGAVLFTRRYVGRSVAVAALFYVAMLSPLLGFIMLYTFQYTFVADHYQYVASIGPIALAAAGISWVFGFSPKRVTLLRPALCGALLVALGLLTWQQCRMYAGPETLWRATIARNPQSLLAQYNLGLLLAEKGQWSEAIDHYQQALVIQPGDLDSQNNLAWLLATCPEAGLRDGVKAVELARAAVRVSDGKDPGYLDTLAAAQAEAGQFPQAVEAAERALAQAVVQKNPHAEAIRARLKLYQEGKPYHEPTPNTRPP